MLPSSPAATGRAGFIVHRGRLRAMLLLGAAACLSACASVPPVWPLSDPPGPIPSYPTVAGTPTECKGDGSVKVEKQPNASAITPPTMPAPATALYCAQYHATQVAADFASEQRALEATQNGETLGLIGLGTAAGVEGVLVKAIEPVRNIGVAAAALAGLSSSLGLTGQRNAYQAAAASVACIIRTDAALDVAQKAVDAQMQSQAAGMSADASTPAAEVAKNAALGDAGAQAEIDKQAVAVSTRHEAAVHAAGVATLSALFAGAHGEMNGSDDITTLGMQTATRAVVASDDAASANTSLVSATVTATDPTTRARALQKAVAAVSATLADSLFKNVNVATIYATAKSGYASLGGKVSTAQTNAAKASSQAMATPAAAIVSMAARHAPHMMRGTLMSSSGSGSETAGATAAGDGMNMTMAQAMDALASAPGMTASLATATQKVTDTVNACSNDSPSAPAPSNGASNQ